MGLLGMFNKAEKPGMLTEELLRKWYEESSELDTSTYTEVSKNAVKYLLKKDKGGYHYLDGVRSISQDVAALIAQLEGSISLKGLEVISDEIASTLTKMQRGRLVLSGVTLGSASPFAIKQLLSGESYERGETGPCAVEELNYMNTKVAQVIHDSWNVAEDSFHTCTLTGMTSIEEDVASVFSEGNYSLDLSGLQSISVVAAKELAKRRGDLHLSGLTDLPDEIALALANRVGDLYLDGLEDLSDSCAEALASIVGQVSLSAIVTLSETAITSFSSGSCTVKIRKVLESIGGETDFFEKEFIFPETKTLNTDDARILALHHGRLSFPQLTTLSEDVAKILSQHRGGLSFDAITKVSDSVAQTLAQSEQFVRMENLEQVSQTAFDALVYRSWGADLGVKHGLVNDRTADRHDSEVESGGGVEDDYTDVDALIDDFLNDISDVTESVTSQGDSITDAAEDVLRAFDELDGSDEGDDVEEKVS